MTLHFSTEGEEQSAPCEVVVHEVSEPYSLHFLVDTGEASAQKTIDSADIARELRTWTYCKTEGLSCLQMSAKVEKEMTKYVRFGN